MPGTAQIRVLHVLAHETPLPMQEIRRRCGATTRAEHQVIKRAVWLLIQQGLVERRARGVYALVIDLGVLLRARYPKTEYGKEAGRQPHAAG